MDTQERIVVALVMVGYLLFLIYRNRDYFKKDK